MNSNTSQAALLIQTAYRALQSGDRKAALRAARQAAELAPQREEPWLILAVVAEPRASLAYIEQALKINPDSQRAKEGLRWVQARLNPAESSKQHANSLPHKGRLALRARNPLFAALLMGLGLVVLLGGLAIWQAKLWPDRLISPSAQAAFSPTASAPAGTDVQAVFTPAAPEPAQPTSVPEPALIPVSNLKEAASATAPAAPRPELASSSPPPIGPTPAGQTYIVQPGDSLPQIASRYKVEPLALMQANHIANPLTIEAGQVLVIPRSSTSGEFKKVIVDISDQRLYAYDGSESVYSFVVSTGQSDGTLRGNFSVLDKLDNPYSEMWGFWMPHWLGIYQATDTVENGIHALPVLVNGQRLWGDSLGQPVSSGCVVLSPEDAQLLYDWVNVGTPVLIRN